jgi:hypothetical protein
MRLLIGLFEVVFSGENRWRFEEVPANGSPGIVRFKMGYHRRAGGSIVLIILGLLLVAWGMIPGNSLVPAGFFLIPGLFGAFWVLLDRKEMELDGHSRTITYFIREPNFRSVLRYPYGRLRSLTLGYPPGERHAALRVEADDEIRMMLGRGSPASLLNLARRISDLTGLPITQSVIRHLDSPAVATSVQIITAEECSSQGVCPVCMSRLQGVLLRCERCRTAHHHDCWKYFGGCAIYACVRP